MHVPDLSALPGRVTTLGVGWRDLSQPFTRGQVATDFFSTLMRLLVDPWQPAVCAGRHPCPFCRFSGGPGRVRFDSTEATVGNSNLFVPGNGVLYVAPSLIAHYVDAHEYRPPDEFVDAVNQCPPMRSMEYLRRLKAAGGMDLIRAPHPS